MDILLAEDERVIRESLKRLLEANGYSVRAASDGEAALRIYRERRPDALLLDVMMPRRDGLSVCKAVREVDAETPILFLTALDSDADELRGLGVGADAYVAKTVSEEVLLARLAAAVRRRGWEPTGDFDFAGWRVESARLAMRRGEAEAALTEREVAILRWFAQHPGEVFSRDFLITRFWGVDFEGGDNALTVALGRLKAKLGEAAAALVTLRGSGYAFRPGGVR